MNGLALGGGFLNGLAQGLNDAALREEKINNWKIAQEAAKAQVEQMKFKASQEARKQNLIDMLLKGFEEKHQGMVQNEQQPAPPQPQPEGTPMGESFFNGNGPRPLPSMASSVPSQQSQADPQGDRFLQMISDPRVLIALKESGLDVTSIAKMAQDKSELSYKLVGDTVVWFNKFGNIVKIEKADIPVKQETRTRMDEQGNEITETWDQYKPGQEWISKRPTPTWLDVTIPGSGPGSGQFKSPFNPYTQQPANGMPITGPGPYPGSIQVAPNELRTVTEATPGGGKKEKTIGKFDPFAVQTELDAKDKPKPAGEAGRSGMVLSAMKEFDKFKNLILTPDGEDVNMGNLASASKIPFKGGLPFSKGREINSLWAQIKEVPARFNTGAAMRDTEERDFEMMFKPSALDSKSLVKDKLGRLETYVTGIWSEMYPGRKLNNGELSVTVDGKAYVITPTVQKESAEDRIRRLRRK